MLRKIGSVILCLYALTAVGCESFGEFMVDALGAVAESVEFSIGPSESESSPQFVESDKEDQKQHTQVNDPKAPVIVVKLGDWIKEELRGDE